MKHLNKIITICLLISLLSINGCGLILSGNKGDVYINSNPDGAKVYIDGLYFGKTPIALTLKSNKDYLIEFRKDGYEKQTRIVNSSIAGGYIILDVLFGLVPIVIDAATGGWCTLDDDFVIVPLEKTPDKK